MSPDYHPQAAPRWTRLADAAALALEIHTDQLRKGTDIPYVSHLLAVAAIVLEHGGDEDQAIAGLLHDAVEDAGAGWEPVIAERFGSRVARIVRGCMCGRHPERKGSGVIWLPERVRSRVRP